MTRTKQDYPYQIPRFTPQEGDDLRHCERAAVLEFVRIELLLRSKLIMELYRALPTETHQMYLTKMNRAGTKILRKPPTVRNQPSGDNVLQGSKEHNGYHIQYGWEILNGAHHHLLRAGQTPSSDAVVDIQAVALRNLAKPKPRRVPAEDYLLLEDSSYICLRFKITGPLAHLQEALEAHYKTRRIDKAKELSALIEQEGTKKGPVIRAASWLRYLDWYDRYTMRALTAGQIAQQDFPDDAQKKTKQIEKGIRQVERMMSAAVTRQWPPSDQYLH